MTYIYDVLLNFTDDDRLVEFYEWQEDDSIEHIKRILLMRLSSKQIEEIDNYKIKVPKEFLDRIKNRTISYKKHNDLKYALLVSDLNKVFALEFNNKGVVISKSSLLLDEAEDIMDECSDLIEETFSYQRLSKYKKDIFLTREEVKRKKYLLQEIKVLYEDKNKDKLNYLYDELYPRDLLSFDEKYLKIKKELEEDYSSKHNSLYDIVRLTYMKK